MGVFLTFFVIFRETRTGNNLYQELSFQDSEALCDVDEGADITGKSNISQIFALKLYYFITKKFCEKSCQKNNKYVFSLFFLHIVSLITLTQLNTSGGWVHPGDFASAGWCRFLLSLPKHSVEITEIYSRTFLKKIKNSWKRRVFTKQLISRIF